MIAPGGITQPPDVTGFVANIQRRKIFVNANRVGNIDANGVRLVRGSVDFRRFERRSGELLAKEDLLDRPIGGEVVNDIALHLNRASARGWEVSSVSLTSAGMLRRRRAARTADWRDVPFLFDAGPMARQVAEYRDQHPADMAKSISLLPLERQTALAAAMDDEHLADLLQELDEEDQVRLIESLDVERGADVLEEMQPDDAADLLAELPADEREELLEAMEPEESAPLRRLLSYRQDTAGGLMTPEPLIVTPGVTVAEVLARIRVSEVPSMIAATVFVVEAPVQTPTGRYLGNVGFQRLLREPPGLLVGDIIDDEPEPVGPDTPDAEVARRLAAYDALAIPVCDELGRLLGAVTADDVLDHVLPDGWRRR